MKTTSGGKAAKTELKMLQGILVLIDIVNFTGQAQNLGEAYTAKYSAYFQSKIKKMVENHGFRVIKFLGDAALVFGKEPGNLLEIMLDLFGRDKPEDKFGFVSRFRMAAHFGFFQFEMKKGRPRDLVSSEGIKVFRMEKYAGPRELMVTRELYQGIKHQLTGKNIQASRLVLKEPLKGFDSEEWFPPFYKLAAAEKETGAANLLEKRMEELAREVEFIPVFGNMYPKVPMDENFIDLAILCDAEGDKDYGNRREEFRRREEKGEDDWIFHERLERRAREDFKEIDVHTLYKNKNKKYTGGVIFGLPGAGKTTILRHLAYKEFKANTRRKAHGKKIVLYVPAGTSLFTIPGTKTNTVRRRRNREHIRPSIT